MVQNYNCRYKLELKTKYNMKTSTIIAHITATYNLIIDRNISCKLVILIKNCK